MLQRMSRKAGTWIAMLVAAQAAVAASAPGPSCQISSKSIGPINIGMTIEEAQKSLPQASFSWSSGADGTAILGARVGNETLLLSEFGEKPAQGRAMSETQLVSLETFSEQCRDENGIGPGTLLRVAAAKLGGIKVIRMSEIESREYVTFKAHPMGRWYRIDYTGIFSGASPSRTVAHQPNARILSVGVDALPHDD